MAEETTNEADSPTLAEPSAVPCPGEPTIKLEESDAPPPVSCDCCGGDANAPGTIKFTMDGKPLDTFCFECYHNGIVWAVREGWRNR